MIVSPNKGVFFVATALMCSASLYGAELTSPSSDPLTRIFVGEPNRLTLPPGFTDCTEISLDEGASTPALPQNGIIGEAALHPAPASIDEDRCQQADKPEPGALALSGRLSAVNENRQESAPLTSVSTAAERH